MDGLSKYPPRWSVAGATMFKHDLELLRMVSANRKAKDLPQLGRSREGVYILIRSKGGMADLSKIDRGQRRLSSPSSLYSVRRGEGTSELNSPEDPERHGCWSDYEFPGQGLADFLITVHRVSLKNTA
ncbi:hypothetical protein Zmor_006467 [Zophobas morio]|uniref:Uncharacterized protein n=1 Tax=Zophobas morio TaxID=2755281 RepID=A0AA38MNF4_9CUCU|nr:hypothetical protein Zmor_006467 [Zophobas morio]